MTNQIITISNLKGGCGKTTSLIVLAEKLKEKHRLLLIDLDAQQNLSRYYLSPEQIQGTISAFDLLSNKATPASDAVISAGKNIDVIRASLALSQIESVLNGIGREQRLKEKLSPIKSRYDYILIDTAPSLNILTINAYTASDKILIPIKSGDLFSLNAIEILSNSINEVRKYLNPDVKAYLFVNEYKTNRTYDNAIIQELDKVAERLGLSVFDTKILKSSAIEQAKTTHEDLYKGKNKKLKDNLLSFVREFVEET